MKFLRRKKLYGRLSLEMEEAISDEMIGEKSGGAAVPLHIGEAVVKKTGVSALLVLFMVVGVTVFLVVKDGRRYRERSESNILKSIGIPSIRGMIYDRYGKPLLKNVAGFRLLIIPTGLPADARERNDTLKEVARIIEVDQPYLVELVVRGLREYKDSVVVEENIGTEQAIALKVHGFRGIRIIDEAKRQYDGGPAFSHVLGYVGAVSAGDLALQSELRIDDVIGRAGLERYYDEVLKGVSGEKILKKDIVSRAFEEVAVREPQLGYSLETSIDADLQKYFFDRLRMGIESLGRKRGVGIALRPQTGEVLALVSIPSYDSNWFISPHRYSRELAQLLSDADQPLFSRAVSGTYNPGSTIKPLIAFAALEEGVVSSEKRFEDPGYLLVPNPYNSSSPSVFLDWRAHGSVDMRKAIAASANVYFYIVGGGTDAQKGIGIERLVSYFEMFNFSTPLGIDMSGEGSGRIPDWQDPDRGEPWRLGDTYNVSIGQGEISITPIGLISSIAALVNGGTLYRPYIVKRIKSGDNTIIREFVPEIIRKNLGNPKNLKVVKEGMRDAIEKPYGTAFQMSDMPFSAGGKSGTAQAGGKTKINALFAAFAPYEKPQIVILVLVEDAREGSLNAIPIAKDVLMWYYLNRGFNQRITNALRIYE
ncbi:MAG: penicillin-binding protein 2 [Parcubacteria group bacterium RIFCSPLOWO2_01_FULL_48_18]|nr:MAG: penicillin-binding protein 2 [Parcubacteria group bacterium RIFCSPLOWO2_01_FULL_48_18]